MTKDERAAAPLPIRVGGDPLTPRLPFDEIRAERLPAFEFPNGVVGRITTCAADFRQVLSDQRFRAARYAGEPLMGDRVIVAPAQPGHLSTLNGIDHLRVRRLAAGDFSPRAIEQRRPYIRSVVSRYLDRMEQMAPPVDLLAAYAYPLPSEIISHLIGVPEDRVADFQRAAHQAMDGRAEAESPGSATRALEDVHAMLFEVLEIKRAEPGDDVISRGLAAEPDRVSAEEIVGLCTNLLFAGHDSTAANVALGAALLLSDPKQRELFMASEERLPAVVESLVRHINIVSDSGALVPRLATEDLEVGGVPVSEGSWVMTSLSMANTDPSACPYSGAMDVSSVPAQHFTFGFGAHTCIGQHLARVEVQEMLWQLLTRFPTLELDESLSGLDWNEKGFVYRMATLPVRW